MTSTKRWLLPLALALLAAPAAFAESDPDGGPDVGEPPDAADPPPAAATLTVKGSVEVMESNDDGSAKQVQITDEASKETYVVVNQGAGAELLKLVGKVVEAVGTPGEGAAGKTLLVASWKGPGGMESTPVPTEPPPEGNDSGEDE